MNSALRAVFTTLYFICNYEWPNKIKYYITVGWRDLTGTKTIAYCAHL